MMGQWQKLQLQLAANRTRVLVNALIPRVRMGKGAHCKGGDNVQEVIAGQRDPEGECSGHQSRELRNWVLG